MKLGMTFGLIGGVLGLLIGVLIAFVGSAIGGVGSVFGSTSGVASGGLMAVVALGLPITAIVGAALSPSKPQAAMWLMGLPGVAFLGLGAAAELNWFLMIIGALLIAGVYCVFSDSQTSSANETEE